jgi:dipeptidase D
MTIFDNISPAPIWKYFEEICKIPRLSKNEGKIRKYMIRFAEENGIESKEDETGNILLIRPASPGMKNIKTIVLQSHLDMVGEKNADHPHNWSEDPIVPVLNDGWISALGTTLGADDGIGIATQMAILTDKNLNSGKIECLFTVDEESGMTGAINLKPDFFDGRILINLDSEDEGILFIGCAGGMDTIATMKYDSIPVGDSSSALEIAITGLHGGHSGDEIHKGYGNSVKIMNRLLHELTNRYGISVSHLDGGNLRNAIPREAFATIVLKNSLTSEVNNFVSKFHSLVNEELAATEKDLKISLKETVLPASVMDQVTQVRLIDAISACPHGVIEWSKEMEDLVETSTNLASVKFTNENTVKIVTTQRSSVEKSKHDIASKIESIFRLAGAEVVHSDGYPGWKPDLNSEILRITRKSYTDLFGTEPQVKAIHAGLECGLIYEKFKGIDMISIGPTIRGAHTPEEKIEIRSTQMFWDLLLDVIKNIPYESARQQ